MKLTKILGLTTLAIVLSACVPRNDTIYIDADEPLNSPQEIEILEPPIIDIE